MNQDKFDFEAIYKLYPRKIGKLQGISTLRKTIKTQQDYDDFCKAVRNYTLERQQNASDITFIKHFSSFVGTPTNPTWRDYIEEEEEFVPLNKSEVKQSNNLDALNQVLQGLGTEKL